MLKSKKVLRNHSLERLLKSLLRMSSSSEATLEGLKFDNKALRTLPIDNVKENYTRTVSGACFSIVTPTPLKNPEVVVYSTSALQLLDIPESEAKRSEFAEYFSGNKLLPDSETSSHCYCGHQFGSFAGQLGDGAAISLGEIINKKGERWELQLKGAGVTPYSRSADGRKVLRSSIREFLCSEAMHGLGIPTTRAASCITSDDTVVRDIFYDGHPRNEKCTVVSRIAPTFIRFGSFEIFKLMDPMTGRRGSSYGRTDILNKMIDYVVETFYPEIWSSHSEPLERYKKFYAEVVARTAKTVALWQCVGFCHGVLNTDNMSIVGVTIDYGPFGFLDRYDPDFVCNSSDDGARYTYAKQPEICKWNLHKLGEALQQVLPLEESSTILDQVYQKEYRNVYLDGMRKKLGLIKEPLKESTSTLLSDEHLIESLFETMQKTGADFSLSFRSLNILSLPRLLGFEDSLKSVLSKLLSVCSSLDELLKANEPDMDSRQFQMLLMLLQTNPELLEQLGRGREALERVMAKLEAKKKLKDMSPETKRMDDERLWSEWLEKYVQRLEYEIRDIGEDLEALSSFQEQRVEVMNRNNPRIVLRNHVAQSVITKAEKGDYTEVRKVLKMLLNPYDAEAAEAKSEYYDCKPPSWACELKVSCSS